MSRPESTAWSNRRAVLLVFRAHRLQLLDQHLEGHVLDIGLVHQIFAVFGQCAASGGIEQFFLELGMHLELGTGLLDERPTTLFVVFAVHAREIAKGLLSPLVILLEHVQHLVLGSGIAACGHRGLLVVAPPCGASKEGASGIPLAGSSTRHTACRIRCMPSRRDPAKTQPSISGQPTPRLPHEHDESADSQHSEPRRVFTPKMSCMAGRVFGSPCESIATAATRSSGTDAAVMTPWLHQKSDSNIASTKR